MREESPGSKRRAHGSRRAHDLGTAAQGSIDARWRAITASAAQAAAAVQAA